MDGTHPGAPQQQMHEEK